MPKCMLARFFGALEFAVFVAGSSPIGPGLRRRNWSFLFACLARFLGLLSRPRVTVWSAPGPYGRTLGETSI